MDPQFDGVIFHSAPEEIARRLRRNFPALVVLDVRELSDFIDGRLPGAIPTPNGLEPGVEVLVVGADSTDPRVRAASRELLKAGHRVSELAGGIRGWRALDLPLEQGSFDSRSRTDGSGSRRSAEPEAADTADEAAPQTSGDSPGDRETEELPTTDGPRADAAGRATLFWDVDTQVDFMHPDGRLYVPEAETLLDNLVALSRAADEHGLPVLASADDHEPDDAEISDNPDFENTYPPHCMRGTEGVERVEVTGRAWTLEVGHEPRAYEQLKASVTDGRPQILVHKKRFDVFTNPNVEPLLKALDPGRIVIYGVALDVCNKAAVEGLLDRGYTDLTVVTDATKPIRKEVEEELLQSWKDRGVELATTAEVVEGLSS